MHIAFCCFIKNKTSDMCLYQIHIAGSSQVQQMFPKVLQWKKLRNTELTH